jgi:hypothetical protein
MSLADVHGLARIVDEVRFDISGQGQAEVLRFGIGLGSAEARPEQDRQHKNEKRFFFHNGYFLEK